MEQAFVFKGNRSQFVCLPKSVALPDDVTRVEVIVVGRTRILAPVGDAWTCWFDGLGASDDFMVEREQPVVR